MMLRSRYGLAAAGEPGAGALLQTIRSVGPSAAAADDGVGLGALAYACHGLGDSLHTNATVHMVHSIVRAVISLDATTPTGGFGGGGSGGGRGGAKSLELRREAREACITAMGAVGMRAIAQENAETAVGVARALVGWVEAAEVSVSPAGMSGLDRQPGREAAAQGLVQLWGGADGGASMLQWLSSAPQDAGCSSQDQLRDQCAHVAAEAKAAPRHSNETVLAAMIRVLAHCTTTGAERERYVLGYAKEAQRRLMNAQAAVHAVASGSPPAAIAPSMLYTSMCPYTDGSSPL
jgi:hypothetical protein